MQQFNHPNIIRAIEYKNELLQDYIITEYMDYGDLLSFVSNYKCKLLKKKFVKNRETCEKFWKTIFIQVVDALIYMKSLGWAHLDLKPENILINSNFEGKIAYDAFQSDVFSLGITFNNLLGVYDLFPTPKNCTARDQNYLNMKEGKFDKIWLRMGEKTLCKYFSQEFKQLLEKMLDYDPEKRINIEEIRENILQKNNKTKINYIMNFIIVPNVALVF